MREVGLLFLPPMVRALHHPTRPKTQTRRLHLIAQPGDLLWVREAWRTAPAFDHLPPRDIAVGTPIRYEADGEPATKLWGKLRPSLFLPKWACRTWLEVTEVRNQQLHAISVEDAIAEGMRPDLALHGDDDMMVHHVMLVAAPPGEAFLAAPIARYVVTWDGLNGKTAPWRTNPRIWAYTFREVER